MSATASALPPIMRAALLAAARQPLVNSRGHWRAADGTVFRPKTIHALIDRRLIAIRSTSTITSRAKPTKAGLQLAHLIASPTEPQP